MKRTALVLILFMSIHLGISAQFQIAIKGGIHSVDLPNQLVSNDAATLNFKDSNFGYHFGVHPRISLLGLFVEPGITFNSSSVDYVLNDNTLDNIVTENYKDVGIPVMVGFGVGLVNIFGGPVAHLIIDDAGDVFRFSEYGDRFEKASVGFRTGIGVKIWKLRAEASYEGNLSRLGESVEVADHQFAFGKRASRLALTVGIIL